MEYDLEKEYERYLDLNNLKVEKMHPDQLRETKRAWYGGVGQMLVMGDAITVNDAAEVMKDLKTQVMLFWEGEAKEN